MKRLILLFLLLTAALSLSGCLTIVGDDPAPEETTEPVDVIDTVPETEVWTRQHKSVWGGEPQPVSAPSPDRASCCPQWPHAIYL